jgi:heterodisulfide reductase subunit C2
MSIVNLSQQAEDNQKFINVVKNECGENFNYCYQCGKCSAGCPVAHAMDIRPNRIIRLLQLGYMNELLNSRTIWLCATCSTCTSRCPRNIDLAKIIDTLRIIAYRFKFYKQAQKEALFHELFMKSMAKHGRVYELGLAVGYLTKSLLKGYAPLYELGLVAGVNLKKGGIIKDALGLPFFMQKKMPKLPHKVRGGGEVQMILDNCKKLEGGH